MNTTEIKKLLNTWGTYENNFILGMYKRFLMDCKYYFGYGNKYAKYLWAGDEYCMVELMKGLASIMDNRKILYNKKEWEDFQERLIPNNYYSLFDYFKYTEDGFICKASKEALNCLETQNLAVSLIWESFLDFVLAGEDGCISNYDMYTPIYSYKTDKLYLIPYSVAENWKKGEIIEICNGRKITDEEMKNIENFNN